MEQMDFSIEVSESETEKFADYLYQKENAKATINKYMADMNNPGSVSLLSGLRKP